MQRLRCARALDVDLDPCVRSTPLILRLHFVEIRADAPWISRYQTCKRACFTVKRQTPRQTFTGMALDKSLKHSVWKLRLAYPTVPALRHTQRRT